MTKLSRLASSVSALLLAAAVATGVGCASSEKSAAQDAPAPAMASVPVNSVCPMSGEPVNTALTSSYKGKTIGFCCDGCKMKFDAADAATKDKVLGKAQPVM